MMYKVLEVRDGGEAKTSKGMVRRNIIVIKDEKNNQYEASLLGTPPNVGDYISAELEKVEKNGTIFWNLKKIKPSEAEPKDNEPVNTAKDIRIMRQGFMNTIFNLYPAFQSFEDWYAFVMKAEPLYRAYVETGKILPLEELNEIKL